ncbi:MAG: anthranilate synthase family protein, partial [Catenulispora sp.]
QGRQTLDAPILIRTAEISPAGHLRVPVGATLVRHSTTAGEVAETYTKAAGVLAALGVGAPPPSGRTDEADDPAVRAALAARNDGLARFWLDQRTPGALAIGSLTGRSAVIVDAEDTFTAMLAHQLKALGLAVRTVPWHVAEVPPADLVVVGPGPGDPSSYDPKMVRLRALVSACLATATPMLAVCLGHQILAGQLGLALERRETTYQGVARDVDLFGTVRRVGFYSSFTARAAADRLDSPYGPVEIARDQAGGAVHGLRGPAFAGVQFHPESVLSRDGLDVLAELLPSIVPSVVSPSQSG